MSEKAPLWDSMVARYGLHATPYDQIANWAFVDWMLNFGEETIQSTIKIRQAGFADCIDTHQRFRRSSPDFANCASSPEQMPSYRAR
jgi:hypothetical protein